MRWANASDAYGLVSIAIHWIAAVAIVGLFVLGVWMVDLSYAHPWYGVAPDLHRGIGVLLGGLILVRLGWRLAMPRPAFEAGMKPWERGAALIAHWVMYAAMVAVVVSGYLITTADGKPVDVLGWFELPAVQIGIERQSDWAGWVHYYTAWGLVLLAGGHTAAALKHHFINRDRTLIKMLRPGG